MNMQFKLIKEKMRTNKSIKREPMSLGRALVSIGVLSLAAGLVQSLIQNGFFSHMHFLYLIYPAIVLLNALPVFLVIALLYFMFGRIWIGTAIAYVPLVILNIANYFKTYFRDEPLKMTDLSLINEMQNITQNYELKISFGIITGVVLAVAAVYLAARFYKTKKLKWYINIIGVLVTVLCMGLSYDFIYTDKQLYEKIPTFAIEYHDTDMAKHHGMLYSFLVSADSATYQMPEGYSDEAAEELLAQYASAPVGEKKGKINVIAIMGEAFFDVTRGETAQFVSEKDPYKNYHRIKAEGYHGEMIVPGFGGSTETTEFEFLTGASQYALDQSMPTAYKTYVTQPAYSLVRYFKNEGYDAVAIHPGYAWFYNRQNAYLHLGFDEFISREKMDENPPMIYGYIEDEYTTQQIIGDYLEHYNSKPETPYFNFTVTIQNHGPYPDFDNDREVVYEKPEGISDEHFWIINNYLTGVKATDKLLGDVCDFADSREEPVVVLFFGDHLPYLDEKIECFDILGYNISHRNEEGIENKYSVEYVMWSNDAAKNIIGNVKRGKGPEISSGFLGAELLDYMRVDKPAYFEFVSSVRKKINVISPNYYKSDDEIFYGLDDEDKELIDKYKILQYYNFRRYNKD